MRRPNRLAFEVLEGRRLLTSFVVTNVGDEGPGSLRQALLDANGASGSVSRVEFAIPGPGVHVIAPRSPLPAILYAADIEGPTQPGYSGSPLIELDGRVSGSSGLVDGLVFEGFASGSTVRGLAIGGFSGDGLRFRDVASHLATVQGNDLGVAADGRTALGNGDAGVEIDGGADNTIGGVAPGQGNLISANGSNRTSSFNSAGIIVNSSDHNLIAGNLVGTDASGTGNLGNFFDGISLSLGSGNTISGNVVAFNGLDGIALNGTPATLDGNREFANAQREAELVVRASVSEVNLAPDQPLTIVYTITNRGPATATGVGLAVRNADYFAYQVAEVPPQFFDFTRIAHLAAAATSQGSITTGVGLESAGRLAELGTLAPGASASVVVTILDDVPGSETLAADASSDQEPPPGVASGRASTLARFAKPVNLAASAAAPSAPVKIGEPATLSFLVANRGTATTNATFALDVAGLAGATILGVTTSQGTSGPATNGPTLTLGNLGPIAPGGFAAVTVRFVPASPGPLGVLFATVPTDGIDINLTDNLAFAVDRAVLAPRVARPPTLEGAKSIEAVVIRFDAPLVASTVTDLRNDRLTDAGSGRRIALRSAEYDPSNSTLRLRLAHPVTRSGGPLRLVISGLVATDGSGLDGGTSASTIPRR